MNYYKRSWDESTGDPLTDNWGTSIYYFETDDNGNVIRQMEIFTNGNAIKYDTQYIEDKFGGLSEAPLDPAEFAPFTIPAVEFEQRWATTFYKKFPEIIFTNDVLWGQPRLEGRRLAVGDIVSQVSVEESISVAAQDYEMSIQQVRQALSYCSTLQCVKDQVIKYCHNCTLRVQQDGECFGEEQDNWIRAGQLLNNNAIK